MGEIKSYPSDTTPQSSDRFLFQDGSTDATKFMTYGSLRDNIAGAAWVSWSPTWTNLSVGDGTAVYAYVQVGKTVHFRIKLIFGSLTSVSGSVDFTLPVNSIAAYAGVGESAEIGLAKYLDSGTATYTGVVQLHLTASKATLLALGTAGSYLNNLALNSTAPFTWAVNDEIHITGTYESV